MKFQKKFQIANPHYVNSVEIDFDNGNYGLTFMLTKEAYFVHIGTEGFVDKMCKITKEDQQYIMMHDVILIQRDRLQTRESVPCTEKEKIERTIQLVTQEEPNKQEITEILNQINEFMSNCEKAHQIKLNVEKLLTSNLDSISDMKAAASALDVINVAVTEQAAKLEDKKKQDDNAFKKDIKNLTTGFGAMFNGTKSREENSDQVTSSVTAPGLTSTPASEQQ